MEASDCLIKLPEVVKVYSGKVGRCCCGCSGKYSYASTYAQDTCADRVNDRSVRLIVNKMNKLIAAGETFEVNSEYIAIAVESRLYIAYMRQK